MSTCAACPAVPRQATYTRIPAIQRTAAGSSSERTLQNSACAGTNTPCKRQPVLAPSYTETHTPALVSQFLHSRFSSPLEVPPHLTTQRLLPHLSSSLDPAKRPQAHRHAPRQPRRTTRASAAHMLLRYAKRTHAL